MNYCSNCGAKVDFRTPPNDDRPRFVCDVCHVIHYRNPIVVVGCVAQWRDQILLCRRAIEPRYDKWTLPAGFLENGETVAEGAIRETREEACASVEHIEPFALFNLTFVQQVYILFRADLADLDIAAGAESLEVNLFSEAEIPWNRLAFPVMRETLKLYFSDRAAGSFSFHMGDIAREQNLISNIF